MRRSERAGDRARFTILLILPAVAAYVILLWFLLKPLTGWIALGTGDEKGILSALRYDPGNARYHYLLGKYYHLDLINPAPEKAVRHYRRSLDLNPLQAQAWFNISKALQITGQNEDAAFAFERALKINPNDPDLMWDAGTFYLMNNRTDLAVSAFRQYIMLMPERQSTVYDLCWRLNLDNGRILSSLLPDTYEHRSGYLLYLIRTGRPDASHAVWDSLDKDSLEENVFLSYMNSLINNSLYERADTVWREITKELEGLEEHDSSSPLWNPGFENEVLNGGFDWVVRETAGVDVFIDDVVKMAGNRSLGVTFDGEHNPGITIARQVVRATPGTHYRLRGHIKTQDITTRNGIRLSVRGHNCSGLSMRSDSVTGTNFWKEITLDFETPPECSAIIVDIGRDKSTKLDNKIRGTAWIDGIHLKQRADILKTSFSRP